MTGDVVQQPPEEADAEETSPETPVIELKDRYKYAADQASAVLMGQRADLSSFQTRSQAVLSSSALTTTVIGAVSKAGLFGAEGKTNLLQGREIIVIGVLFVLTAVASLLGMWPRRGWQFQLEPAEMIAAYDAVPAATDAEVYRNAADSMVDLIENNVDMLATSVWLVRIAQVLLVLQIVFFLGVITARGF